MIQRIAFILLMVTIFSIYSLAKTNGLIVEISKIDNNEGWVLISIYDQEDNFPYKPFKTYSVEKDSMLNGNLEYIIEDITQGIYAITLLDDKNMNRDMDTNWLGVPKEGFGFSNNIKPSILGAPPFGKCTFKIEEDLKKIKIEMQYL